MTTEEDNYLTYLRTTYPHLTFIEFLDNDPHLKVDKKAYDEGIVYAVVFRKRSPLLMIDIIKNHETSHNIKVFLTNCTTGFVSTVLNTNIKGSKLSLDNYFDRSIKKCDPRGCPICCDNDVTDLCNCISCGKSICFECHEKLLIRRQMYGICDNRIMVEECHECPFCRNDFNNGKQIEEMSDKIDYKSV